MAEQKEERATIIPKNDYQADLEAEVALHVERINALNPFKVNKKYSHIVIPEFKPNEWRERLDWELEEIRRCREGYNGLPGRYYYLFNHTSIKQKGKGKIRPDFRATQLNWAITKDRVRKKTGTGIVMIKRRQVGMSWDMAVDDIYDCQFFHEFEIGMNSKGILDSQTFLAKHKYIHRNQSPFLRSYVHTDKRDAMVFGKWLPKEQKWKGTMSSIITVAPTPTGHAGNQYIKLVMDEAGEFDLVSVWSNAEDCIMQDGIRVGTPYIFGTVGDTASVGQGIMEFWKNHKSYNLEQFAFWGYNCLIMDDWGNDMIEDSVRWIIYERKKREAGATKVLRKFMQKYPLTELDAFLDASGSGVGDPLLLNSQRLYLFDNPPQRRVGWMRPGMTSSTPEFYPDEVTGKVIFYDWPDSSRVNGYISNCDPAEDDDVEKTRDTSELSMTILSKPFGLEPPKLIVEYCDRPKKLHEYYYQVALILQLFNNQKIHIELNKGGWRMLDWFEQNFPHLVAFTPGSPNSVTGAIKMTKGVKMTPERKIQLKGLGDAYVENYYRHIPSIKLIDQLGVVGAKGKDDDLAVSFLWDLAILQGDKIPVGNVNQTGGKEPTVDYVKRGGRIQLVGPTGETLEQSSQIVIPKSSLFNKR